MLEHNDKPHVTIKPGSRTLVIPNETKIIGVAGDEGAERINFDLPRWYDGSDLGGKTWYVDVRNPLGQYDADMPDVLVDADMVHLEFVVRAAHAAQAGTVIIHLRATDAAGFTWQSEDGEFTLQGSKIERGVPIPEPQITAIDQKLGEMEAVRQTVSAAGAQALADGQTAIATAVAAADDLAATALKTSASAPWFVASGNPVQVKAARKSTLVVTASEAATVTIGGADGATESTVTLTANTPAELQAPDSTVTNILASAGQLTVRYNRDTGDLLRALTCETTDTGATATLHPIRDAPIRVRTEYEAAQEGTGDPSPDNVRSIRGTNVIGTSTTSKWAVVQKIVDAGLGPKAYPVGSQITAHHDIYGDVVFDVVAHDHHKNPDNADAHTMTLLMHDCIYGRTFDQSEMLWANTTGAALPAGTYNFALYKGGNGGNTYEDGTYQFTTAQPIPAGGGFAHNRVGNWYANTADYKLENITSGVITTYNADGTTLDSDLTVTAGSGGISLGTASNSQNDIADTVGRFNSVMRRAYGSDNWAESAARQWLNSDAAGNVWWKQQTIFDRAPGYANVAGLIAGLDPAFVASVGPVDIVTAYNTIYDANGVVSGTYTTRDRFWLVSRAEMGWGAENGISEGSVLPCYDGATEADKIKHDIANPNTACSWWLRSPHSSIADIVRHVNPSGALDGRSAYSGYGLAAACVIYGSPQNTSVVDLPETVYGLPGAPAVYDSETGIIADPTDCIASYNGEDVGNVWMSSTGALTTGAQVVYKLPTPRYIQAGRIELGGLDGETVVYSNGKRVTATSLEDPKYRAAQVNARLAALESAVTNQTI